MSPRVRAKLIIAAAARDADDGLSWTFADLERAMVGAMEAQQRDAQRGTLSRVELSLMRLERRERDPHLRPGIVRCREWLLRLRARLERRMRER